MSIKMTHSYKTLDNIDCLERGNLDLIRSIIMILLIMVMGQPVIHLYIELNQFSLLAPFFL